VGIETVMAKSALDITLVFDSTLENVALADAALRGLVEHGGLSELDATHVQLAVVEALNNVVAHAYQNQPGQRIAMRWCMDSEHLRIEIHDQGRGMTELPGAALPSFEEEGGRGWPIIRMCMDQVGYRSDQDGNVLTLIKRLNFV
jgi:serine/threonine-protein kinase RsbW